MKNPMLSIPWFLRFVYFAIIVNLVTSASAQTVRDLLMKDPDFRIYSVVFVVTATTNSTLPAIRLAKVTDPKTGTTDAVKLDVPDSYVRAAKKKIEEMHYVPELKDGKPVEFFVHYFYVPGHSNVVIADLNKQINKQP